MKKKILLTPFFILMIIFSLFNFTSENNTNSNYNEQSNSTKMISQSENRESEVIFENNNIALSYELINSTNIELSFINISPSINSSDILAVMWDIYDSQGNLIDDEFQFGNGTNYYSEMYTTSDLIPGDTYNFQFQVIYGHFPFVDNYSIQFSATIPLELEDAFVVQNIIVTNEEFQSSNDGSLNINGTMSQTLYDNFDKVILELRNVTTGELVKISEYDLTSIIGTGDQPFDVMISNLDSGIYNLYIYGMTAEDESNTRDYVYLNSILNIEISYNNEDPQPELYSEIVSAYSTSPTTATFHIYTSNAYLAEGAPLKYSLNGGTPIEIINLDEGVIELNLTDLTPDSTYTLTLFDNNDQELDNIQFSTQEEEIIDAPILSIEKANIDTNSATINYELFSADLITNLTYSLSADGQTEVINEIDDYSTGENTLELTELTPNTIYTLTIMGDHTYDSNKHYSKVITFKTAREDYAEPFLEITSIYDGNSLINYNIKGIDPAHRILSLNFDIYGIDEKFNQDFNYKYLTSFSVENEDFLHEGILIQDKLIGYDNFIVLVNCTFENENGNPEVMSNEQLKINNSSEMNGNAANIQFVAANQTELVDPNASSLFNKTVEIILLIIIGLLLIATILFAAKVFLDMKNNKDKRKEKTENNEEMSKT